MPSATVHAGFAATATRLIDRHGRAMSLVTQTATGPAYNPTIGETSTAVVGVQTKVNASEVDGDLVRSTDLMFLLDSTVEPTTAMRLDDGDAHQYSIVNVNRVKPGMTAILYKVQARI